MSKPSVEAGCAGEVLKHFMHRRPRCTFCRVLDRRTVLPVFSAPELLEGVYGLPEDHAPACRALSPGSRLRRLAKAASYTVRHTAASARFPSRRVSCSSASLSLRRPASRAKLSASRYSRFAAVKVRAAMSVAWMSMAASRPSATAVTVRSSPPEAQSPPAQTRGRLVRPGPVTAILPPSTASASGGLEGLADGGQDLVGGHLEALGAGRAVVVAVGEGHAGGRRAERARRWRGCGRRRWSASSCS